MASPLGGGGGDGGRAAGSCLRMKTRTRATHPALEFKWRLTCQRALMDRHETLMDRHEKLPVTSQSAPHRRAAPSGIARHRVSPQRPPARPAGGGPRKIHRHTPPAARTLSTPFVLWPRRRDWRLKNLNLQKQKQNLLLRLLPRQPITNLSQRPLHILVLHHPLTLKPAQHPPAPIHPRPLHLFHHRGPLALSFLEQPLIPA